MKLTPAETEAMDALWASDRPLTVDEIRQEPHTWKDKSAYIIIGGLLRKGAIRPMGMQKSGKSYARTFEATLARERYLAQLCYDGQQPDTVGLIAESLRQARVAPDKIKDVLSVTELEAYHRYDH